MYYKPTNNSRTQLKSKARGKSISGLSGRETFGEGYFKPNSMPASEFRQLYKIWEDKLVQSGFKDIECRASDMSGCVHPYFRENGSSATFQQLYSKDVEEYYNLAGHFLHEFKFDEVFGIDAELYELLFYWHSNAVSLRKMILLLKGIPLNTPNLKHVTPAPEHLRATKSVFYMFSHLNKVLKHFNEYIASVVK